MPISQTNKEYFEAWHPYDLLIKHNYMRHREIIECLNRSALSNHTNEVTLLELGCGNAYVAPRAFGHLDKIHFTGIDISGYALKAAKKNLSETSWITELIEGDIEVVMSELQTKFDLILAGFSLHHFSSKSIQFILEHTRRCLTEGGEVFVCDIVSRDNESNPDFLERLIGGIDPTLVGLNPDQYESIKHHIATFDFPLDLAQWNQLAGKAGFSELECVYRDEAEKYAVLRFS